MEPAMSLNKKTLATLIIALIITISFLSLASSARHMPASGNIGISGHDMPLLDRSIQNEVIKQQNIAAAAAARTRQQQQLAAMSNILNEPDVADPVQIEQSSLLPRQQRSIVNYDQDFISPLQSLEDEPLMRRQLPDLFAQLRNDKSFEKVLSKLLINSSLRSALMNNGINNNNGLGDGVNWPGNDNGVGRLDQAIDGFAPLLNDLVQSFNQQDSVAKRGSRCAFNAVACKNRKLGYA